MTVTRELLEKVRSLKEYATLGKRRSFQYMSGVPGFAYNAFFLEEARNSYFEFEQIVILNFWVERVWELGTITSQKVRVRSDCGGTSDSTFSSPAGGTMSFECCSWDGPPKASLVKV